MIKLTLVGTNDLLRKLKKIPPIGDSYLKMLTLAFERDVKKATVVSTGRLRSSISHILKPDEGQVMTNVQYAPFVEFGTSRMPARHMEGGRKVLGVGMFTYVQKVFRKTAEKIAEDVATTIENMWGR